MKALYSQIIEFFIAFLGVITKRKISFRNEGLIISESLTQDFCSSSTNTWMCVDRVMQELLPRRGNRCIVSYATVYATKKTDKKTSQASDIIKSSFLTTQYNLNKSIQGITLIELVLVLGIIGVLILISVPSYGEYMDKKDIALAQADIVGIANCIERFYTVESMYPVDLNEGGCGKNDPWGNPYEYFNISTAKGKGKLRKDKSLNPINTHYDLYSKGKDGLSVSPLTAKHSRDDIVRANDGGFVGLATDF